MSENAFFIMQSPNGSPSDAQQRAFQLTSGPLGPGVSCFKISRGNLFQVIDQLVGFGGRPLRATNPGAFAPVDYASRTARINSLLAGAD